MSSQGMRRNNADAAAARDLQARTGMKYTAALALRQRRHQPYELANRWVLTDEVRDLFAGDGWRGLVPAVDLYDWVNGLRPRFECEWCGENGDARSEDSTLEIVMVAFDPDLSPATPMLTFKKHHARCKPSRVVWARPAGVLEGPFRVELPASMNPEVAGGFDITARPLLLAPEFPAVLLLWVEVAEDHGEGAVPWLHELEGALRARDGFGSLDATADEPSDWVVRVVTGSESTSGPEWVAVRSRPPARPGDRPEHMFIGAVPLPGEWVERARGLGHVWLVVGPLAVAGEVPDMDADTLTVEELDDLAEACAVMVRTVPVE
ncbi:hypothetical protein ACFY4C_41870 [Actinomadura viridis]|uniref:hypothetical protein n=1 Tax=Actinomadura viridis TaxID=58110 RepID=UPI00367CECB4